jgi:hypothetical protein
MTPPLEKDCRKCKIEFGECAAATPDECQFEERRDVIVGGWTSAHDAVNEALVITKEDRNTKAGNPEDNFEKIANVWTGLLLEKLAPDQRITPADTARMMIGLKLCRDMHAPHRDNRVDIHGYGLCLERVQPTEKD